MAIDSSLLVLLTTSTTSCTTRSYPHPAPQVLLGGGVIIGIVAYAASLRQATMIQEARHVHADLGFEVWALKRIVDIVLKTSEKYARAFGADKSFPGRLFVRKSRAHLGFQS